MSGHCRKFQPLYHLRGVEVLSMTSKHTMLAIMVEKSVGASSKNSAALPLRGSRTLIYDLQTYHASHYCRKISRDLVQKFSRITTYRSRTLIYDLQTYHASHYDRKINRGIVKISTALQLTGSRALIFDLQTYHASHYGRKIRRGIAKKFSRITTYRSRTLVYDIQTYHASHYGRNLSWGIVENFNRITTYGESNSYLRLTTLAFTYHARLYGQKFSRVKMFSGITTYMIQTLFYNLQTYHTSH